MAMTRRSTGIRPRRSSSRPRARNGRAPPRPGTAGARSSAAGSGRRPRRCSTWPASGRAARVLDVAAGAGEQTLAAARRVGPTGHVLATDISPAILEYAPSRRATRRARATSRRGSSTASATTSLPAASFDAAISRVGLIYFPDQQRALAGIRHALKPGGRFAAIVYSTPDRNAFFSIPVAIIRRRAQLPPPLPGQPGPFSLGGEGVLAGALEQAGFRDVDGARGRFAGAPADRRRMRALRARVLRRAAPDDGRPRRGRARRDLGGDRARAPAVRDRGRLRRPVRDAGRRRDAPEASRDAWLR